MPIRRFAKPLLRIVLVLLAVYVLLVLLVFFRQRSMLYFPTHLAPSTALTPWVESGGTIGFCREVPNPRAVWMMTHGNGGQAADRDYVLKRMPDQDSLYVLEYPGYGAREGSPSLESMNGAASEAYRVLRSRYTNTPVCVLGESIGSGPACSLAVQQPPPDKIVLVVPFDSLASVASERFFFLPVRLILHDSWNNVRALEHYAGPVDILGAVDDVIVPISHARALAKQITNAHFTKIDGGHNDWSLNERVKISR